MAGSLATRPSNIVQQMLVDLGGGTAPADNGSWPVYWSHEPDTPDDAITVYDTEGVNQGRIQIDGEVQMQHGIQIRIRGETVTSGGTKANALQELLDKSVRRTSVTVSGTDYIVHSFNRVGDARHIGQEPETRRQIYTLNGLVSLRQTS